MNAYAERSHADKIRATARRHYGAAPDATDGELRALWAKETVHRALARAGFTQTKRAKRAVSFVESLLCNGAAPIHVNIVVNDIARLASGLRPAPNKKPHYVLRGDRWFIGTRKPKVTA